ncbi:Flp family type IVb pilin [Falsochrobactrum sp. TDYN1]|uniref:Flp family type IVb pilin n=1 Tax=Falsochrobactrum tianjinense TaxID=2706015 RepID=A0A949PLL1_9HYPH|nr:Flp family type IVb pilin [Falsochrobactrum sp. TDYN1]MBV2142179.1 Flp family type IVb pilin [Falsochrobactrum sp. TDYN1]
MPALMTRFLRNRSGAAMIECTLIGALAIIAVISGLALFAGKPASALNYQSVQAKSFDQR